MNFFKAAESIAEIEGKALFSKLSAVEGWDNMTKLQLVEQLVGSALSVVTASGIPTGPLNFFLVAAKDLIGHVNNTAIANASAAVSAPQGIVAPST